MDEIQYRQQVIEINVPTDDAVVEITTQSKLYHDRIIGAYIEDYDKNVVDESMIELEIGGVEILPRYFKVSNITLWPFGGNINLYKIAHNFFEEAKGSEIRIKYTDKRYLALQLNKPVPYKVNLVLITTVNDIRPVKYHTRIQILNYNNIAQDYLVYPYPVNDSVDISFDEVTGVFARSKVELLGAQASDFEISFKIGAVEIFPARFMVKMIEPGIWVFSLSNAIYAVKEPGKGNMLTGFFQTRNGDHFQIYLICKQFVK